MEKRKIFSDMECDRWQDKEEKADRLLAYIGKLSREENEALMEYRREENETIRLLRERDYFAANARLCAAVEVMGILGIYDKVCEYEEADKQ